MAKKVTKPTVQQRLKSYWSNHKKLSIFLLIVGSVVLYIFISNVVLRAQIYQERKQFFQTKVDLHNVYNQIISEVGVPDRHESISKCSYTSVEFGKGTRSCEVGEYVFYEAGSKQEAQNLTNKIQASLISYRNVDYVVHISNELTNDPNQLLNTRLSVANFTGCSSLYEFYDLSNGQYFPATNGVTNQRGLGVWISCTKNTKQEYFSVTND